MRIKTSVIGMMVLCVLANCTSPAPAPQTVRNCPDWSDNPVSNDSNKDFSNFGCAYTNNLQAQLEDKNDLKKGHGIPMQEGDRENINIQKYLTSTPQTLPSLSTSGSGAR